MILLSCLHIVFFIFSYCLFFFFKQKTAYEMRISDWSSDVCSSDLKFGSSYEASFVNAFNWLVTDADKTKLVCANEQYYLLRDSAHTCWEPAKCEDRKSTRLNSSH